MNIEKVVIRRENIIVRAIQNIVNKVDKKQREEELEFEEKILRDYWKYYNTIFNKKIFNELPLYRSWNYAIEIIFVTLFKNCKIHPLLVRE